MPSRTEAGGWSRLAGQWAFQVHYPIVAACQFPEHIAGEKALRSGIFIVLLRAEQQVAGEGDFQPPMRFVRAIGHGLATTTPQGRPQKRRHHAGFKRSRYQPT